MKGLFEGMGGDFSDIFKNINGGKDNKNASDLMNILNSINDSDIKDQGSEMGNMTGIFEQLFDVLLKEDVLTVPLTTISNKLQDYMKKNKEKVSEEDKSKYDQIIKYIDEILFEIKKPTPNKEQVINIFEKLHMIGELPSEIMNDSDENMNMMNFAQNLFKK